MSEKISTIKIEEPFHVGQYAKGRVAMFIDAANIYFSQRTLGWRIDFDKLKKYAEREVRLVSMQFYTGVDKKNSKQKAFLTHLEVFGFRVVSKEIKKINKREGGSGWKGSLDVELALDCFEQFPTFDTLLLFSGDSDFVPLVDRAKKAGKNVFVFSTRGHIAVELPRRARYVELGKLRKALEYKNQEAPKGL